LLVFVSRKSRPTIHPRALPSWQTIVLYEAAYAKGDVKALADFFPTTPNALRMTVKRSMDARRSKEASGLPFRETKGRSCNATPANLEDDDRRLFLLFRRQHSNQHMSS
jgi:hypothetical protein